MVTHNIFLAYDDLHLRLEVEYLVPHASTRVDVEVFSASTCCIAADVEVFLLKIKPSYRVDF